MQNIIHLDIRLTDPTLGSPQLSETKSGGPASLIQVSYYVGTR